MAAKQLTISILFKAIDQLLGPARNVLRAIEDVDRAAARAKGLRMMGDDLSKVGDQLQRIGIGASAAGLAIAAGSGLTAVPGLAIAAQHELLAIANTADLSEREVRVATAALRILAREVNQHESDLTKGLGILTAAGFSFRESMGALPAVGRTATAETAAIEDLANASFAVASNLKVPVSELASVLDVMATAGHAGQFELRDMARYFPELTASASMLGMRGAPAVLSLAAALQIARRGAGDAGTAANNAGNFLAKLASPEVQRNFAKLGVSVKAEIERALRAGDDPIAHMVQLVARLTKGDAFRLGELFGDLQVQNFLKPMLKGFEDFERIKREAARGGVVSKDFERIMQSVAEQSKLFRINMQAIGMDWVAAPLQRFQSALATLNANPALQKMIAGTALGLIAFGTANLALAGTLKLGGMMLNNWGALQVGAAALKAGWLGTASSLTGVSRVLALVAGGLRVATVATWGFTTALLANPITWVVAGAIALAGIAYVIYRNWDRVGVTFRGVWSWLTSAGERMRDAGANLVNQLWTGIQSLASKPVEAFRAIVQRIRNFLPFSPAKEGPLRDLHRVRIIETIAGTMQPAPMLRAIRTVALATAASSAALGTQLPARSAAGITVHYAPQITIGPGASRDTVASVELVMAQERRRLEAMLRQIEHDRDRTSFRRG